MKSKGLATSSSPPAYRGYAVAILSVVAAVALKLLFQRSGQPFPFTTASMFAVALSVWYADKWAGLLGAAISAVVLWLFVQPPSATSGQILFLTNHSIAVLLVVWIAAALRRAERLLAQARDELEVKVQERTAELRQANKELQASEQVARGQVEALAQSLDVLATAPAPEEFIGQMLSTIGRLLNAQSVVLWLLDEPSGSVVLRAAAQGENFAAADSEHPFIKDPLSWKNAPLLDEIFFTGVPGVVEDLDHDPRVPAALSTYFRSKGTRKFMTIPTLVGGHVKGFIGIRHGDRPPYRPEEIELGQALAHQAMFAVLLNQFGQESQKAAVLEERNRMARDVHDTLAQGFTGVILQLEAAQDAISCGQQKDADKHLERAAGLARQSLVEARRSVHALRPDALERDNLWDALKGIIKRTTAGTALHTTFELRGKLPDLPPSWQENLLHIGQEALSNALKYAHAQNFRTRLSCNANEIRLELRDDGAGFEVKGRHDGFGLTGMHERVEQMNGELEITSTRGKGTRIAVSLPNNHHSTL